MGSSVNPVPPTGPPTTVNVGDVATQEVDPKNFGFLWSQGTQNAGWIERLAVAIWLALVKSLQAALSIVASVLDTLLAALADFFLAAQAQNSPGFYKLTAALITDLTGIDIDGDALYSQFQTRGRIAAMQKVGAQIVDTLAGEFAGVAQADAGGVFTIPAGGGIGGLPAVALDPAQGMNAARTFLGFAMSFAVREGNTDFFASLLPFGIGEGFKDYAEDLSKSLGLGRLTRLALKPLFQTLMAIPMGWAMNKQYRPTLLSADQAVRAFNSGLLQADGFTEELARHGFSSDRQNVLQAFHSKYPPESDLFLLELAGKISNQEHRNSLLRIGYNTDTAQQLLDAETLHVKRKNSLHLAQTLLHSVVVGDIDVATYSSVLSRFTLADYERADYVGLAQELIAHPRKQLTFAQEERAFVEGVATVTDLQTLLQRLGYGSDDITVLIEDALLKLKAAQAKAAAKKKPPTSTPGSGA